MIKKILLVSLIATTGLIGVRKMSQPTAGDEVDLVVTNYLSQGDEVVEWGNENHTSAKVGIGNQTDFTVDDLSTDDLEFDMAFVNGYYYENATIGNSNKVVVKGSETEVTNYYTDSSEHLVCLVDTNNKLIGDPIGVNDGGIVSQSQIDDWKASVITPAGYTLETSLYNGDSEFVADTTTVTGNLMLRTKLQYNDAYGSFDVAVTSDSSTATLTDEDGITDKGTGTLNIKFDKKVVVSSSNDDFSYWTIDDKIVSYDRYYTFSIYNATTIVEVVGETVTPEPIVNLYTDNGSDEMDDLFVCGYSLPTGMISVEAGMLFGGTTYETATHKIVAESISENNEFAVKYDDTDKDTNVAYLIYKDSEQNISMVYSEVAEVAPAGTPVTVVTDVSELSKAPSKYDNGKLPNDDNLVYSSTKGTVDNAINGGELTIYQKGGSLEITSSYPITKFAYTYNENKSAGIIKAGLDKESAKTITNFTFDSSEKIKFISIGADGDDKSGRVYLQSWTVTYLGETAATKAANTALDSIVLGNDNAIIDNTALPAEVDEYPITWTCDQWGDDPLTEISSENLIGLADNPVNMKATITGTDGMEYSREIPVTIVSSEDTLPIITSWVKTQLGDIDNITDDITLPTTYVNGVYSFDLTWDCSDHSQITDDGVVTRGDTNVTGQLYYSVNINGENTFDGFDVTVLAEGVEPVKEDVVLTTDSLGITSTDTNGITQTGVNYGDYTYGYEGCSTRYGGIDLNAWNDGLLYNETPYSSSIDSIKIVMNDDYYQDKDYYIDNNNIVLNLGISKIVSPSEEVNGTSVLGNAYMAASSTMEYTYEVDSTQGYKYFSLASTYHWQSFKSITITFA